MSERISVSPPTPNFCHDCPQALYGRLPAHSQDSDRLAHQTARDDAITPYVAGCRQPVESRPYYDENSVTPELVVRRYCVAALLAKSEGIDITPQPEVRLAEPDSFPVD